MDVEEQFKSLGALVSYISPPVDQKICAKKSSFIEKTFGKLWVGGLAPRKIFGIMPSRTSESGLSQNRM